MSLSLYLSPLQADEALVDNKNLLMDFPTHKPPGHTHASWSCFLVTLIVLWLEFSLSLSFPLSLFFMLQRTVPSVPGVKAYLEAQGIPLSGQLFAFLCGLSNLSICCFKFKAECTSALKPMMHSIFKMCLFAFFYPPWWISNVRHVCMSNIWYWFMISWI